MDYLKELNYYEDFYDLTTIHQCLGTVNLFKEIYKKTFNAPDLKHLSEKEKTRNTQQMLNMYLFEQKTERYKSRKGTIEKWVEDDRIEQDKYDNTPAPQGISCKECGKEMQSTYKHLENYTDQPLRVLFFFECENCNKRRGIYDDGTEKVYKPSLCPKCKAPLKSSLKTKGDITTWKTKCTSCKYKEVDITDEAKEKEERLKKEAEDAELLAKYRDEFCLSTEEGNQYVETVEVLRFAHEVYEYEKEMLDDPVIEQTSNLKRLDINDLEKLLHETLTENKYTRLTLAAPEIGQFVQIPFTLQDNDSSRKGAASEKSLTQLLKNTLEKTNWRLSSEGMQYRLGFLSGTLKGYEREEDLQNLVGKKKAPPKKKLDPDKLSKYGHEGPVQLAKLNAKFEVTKKQRMKRLKKETDGFLLEDSSGGNYNCNICHKSIPGSQTWWTPDGITCIECERNLKEEVVPRETLHNRDSWFQDFQFDSDFGIHRTTARKMRKKGEVIGRVLKDTKGNPYFTVFMVVDNIDFIKSHQKPVDAGNEFCYRNEKGEINWI